LIVEVAVVVVCDQRVFAVIQPQIRVNSRRLTGLIAVAVNHDKTLLVNSEKDVGFFSDYHRVRKRRQRSKHSDDKQ